MPESLAGQMYDQAAHFASASGNFEVQRTQHFEVVLDLNKLNLDIDGAIMSEHLRLSVKDISAPGISVDPINLKHGNDTVKVASAPQFEDLDINLYDTIGRDQINLLQAWFNKVFDRRTKLMGKVSSYKTSGTLYMYSPDCEVIRAWDLQGIWPKSIKMGNNFSYDSPDAQTVSLSLSVDRYFERMVKGGN
jgi:hypothetical protein